MTMDILCFTMFHTCHNSKMKTRDWFQKGLNLGRPRQFGTNGMYDVSYIKRKMQVTSTEINNFMTENYLYLTSIAWTHKSHRCHKVRE